MLGNRYSQHSFAQIPDVKTFRSQFDRSHTIKDTFDFDVLVPIFVDEILPGDTCNLTLNTFIRLATPKVPIMDNLYVDFFFMYVPNRLVWTHWEKFNGAQDNPGDSTSYVVPTLNNTNAFTNGQIFEKFGIPPGLTNVQNINALPFRAYNLIWNTWFRDQNMQNSVNVHTDDGPDPVADYALLYRGKRHDYFTSCLPSPQKGAAVSLPLGTKAPINGIGIRTGFSVSNTNVAVRDASQQNLTYPNEVDFSTGLAMSARATAAGTSSFPDIYADLSQATAATINQLRLAIMTQSLLELDMRGGTRYVEILQAHWNVISPDFRLQRPEYLGGGQVRINSHPVAQTAPTSGTNAQGQLAAFATASSSGSSIGFTKSFVEHGYVIGLACARADLTYQQGLERMWSRQTRFDFFWPKLQELGEQAVLNQEIYLQGNGNANDTAVFGYQERYAEYRYKPSQIHGQFRSSYSTPLDFWHMAQQFGSLPTLGNTFIQSSTPIARSIAVTSTGATLLFDAFFSYKHARIMTTHGVPATLGRF